MPVFAGFGAHDGVPSDVDSIVVTIHNPPAADIVISQRIEPGQDSIVLTIDVELGSTGLDTVSMSLEAIRTLPAPPQVLYRADSVPLEVRAGQPTRMDTVQATYVGPGQNIRSISISPQSAALRPGDSLSFTATAIDSGGQTITGMPVLWDSRDDGVARVSGWGMARAVASGTTWIVATSGARSSVKDSAELVVSTTPVASINFAPAAVQFTAEQGGPSPAAQTVAVTNTGAGPLTGMTVAGIQYQSGQATGWLTAALSGDAAPATLTLGATTGGLAPGTHSASVSVASALAANSPHVLTVTFTVTPAPAINLAPATLTFAGTQRMADPAAQTVAVTNSGGGSLTGLAVGTISYGTGSGWLTATLDVTAAPATLTVRAALGTLAAGAYTATIPITSAVAVNSPRNVSVTFNVAAGPTIGLTPAALSVVDTVTTGDPAVQTVAVANAGGGTLSGLALGTITYGASQPTGWITSASLGAGTAPTTLSLTLAKGSLVPGVYTATVPVTSAVAGNSPQSVAVTFDVRPIPLVRMVVAPGFGVLQPAGTLPLAVAGFNSSDGPAPTFGLRYASRSPGVATVDSLTGVVTALSRGSAVVVASAPGATGTVYDSTLVAVAPTGTAVAAPLVGGRAFAEAKTGDTVRVAVTVNIGSVPGEELGSYNAQMNWAPAALQYVSTATGGFAAPVVNEGGVTGGELRFGAADAAGTPGPAIVVVNVKLVAGATGASQLALSLTDLSGISPTFTQMLTQALVLSGGVQVK